MNPFSETFNAVKALDQLMQQAISSRASDIHIEPQPSTIQVRCRIDGLLQTQNQFHRANLNPLISRLKILSNLDIAEQRIPQDGYLELLEQECRLSICPTVHGEKAVLRLLSSKESLFKLDQLGMQPLQQKQFNSMIQKSQGLILVTGPTGSGKSATLYAALNRLNTQDKNICTIEDPVEIQLEGLNQVSIREKTGLTYPRILKSFLRQDPDIIMIGEIRDEETAQIAVKAAQTGHLVLATLHTNSAIESIQRLTQMGVKPYDISHALLGIVAQRLLRRKKDGVYKRRIGVYEVLNMNDNWRQLIDEGTYVSQLKENIDFITMKDAAETLKQQGVTDQDEINRVF